MNYMKINENDIANGEGISVSLFVSGCPHHCPGCFNSETWDFEAGQPFTQQEIDFIEEALVKNNIQRNFSILGGEPLAPENRGTIASLIEELREKFQDKIKIYLWTGYTYEDLKSFDDLVINYILEEIDVLIDGPYLEEYRNITLPLRGSSNQRVLYLKIDNE